MSNPISTKGIEEIGSCSIQCNISFNLEMVESSFASNKSLISGIELFFLPFAAAMKTSGKRS